MEPILLALDFGGTKHSAAIPDLQRKKWAAYERVYVPTHANAQIDLATMLEMADRLLAGRKPHAVGVSFGGPVDPTTGFVRLSHHVPGWENIPLADLLQSQFHAPTRVDNDANVAALGEYVFGAGAGCSSLLYITISTGVGGGWIFNGQIWHGTDGMAGEIGHTIVEPDGPLCLCGKQGCVERLASGPYMARNAAEILQENPTQGILLRQLAGNELQKLNGKIISQAAARGDEVAIKVLTRAARAVGMAIGNAANLINPERIVLGGGVTHSGALFWDTVRHWARQTALPQVNLQILPAAMGDDATLWGAVSLAGGLPGSLVYVAE